MRQRIVVLVDGPNADNQAAAWGAYRLFSTLHGIEVVVIVSATAVNYAENAPLGSRDIALSRRMHKLHTARMAGLFARAGAKVSVFMDLDIAKTAITSPIPHQAHVRHEDYDIFSDGTGIGMRSIKGDFSRALTYLKKFNGITHVVVGGPFSAVPKLIDAIPAEKLGYLSCQAGLTLSQRAIYSQMSFNAEVDFAAFTETFVRWPQQMLFVPSDITRHPSVTFTGADELKKMGVRGEIFEIFLEHRRRAAERHKFQQDEASARGKKMRDYPALSIHDLQAVLVMGQALGFERGYTLSNFDPDTAVRNLIATAGHWQAKGIRTNVNQKRIHELGYAEKGMMHDNTPLPPRLVVTAQSASHYKQRVAAVLR